MAKDSRKPWRQWVVIVVGVIVTLKALAFTLSRIFRVTRSEVNARGSDVNFVLRVADRRKLGA